MKVDTMSRNVVRIMKILSQNAALQKLLINNQENPMSHDCSDEAKKNIMNPFSEQAKILPFPFDTEAKVKDGSFIRVYYNQGDFNANEMIAEADLLIDIIVAKSIWLMHDETKDESLIRPYEIMSRVVDLVGRKGIGDVRLKVEGYQHHYVNTKFDSIRIYCSYMSVETMQQEGR